MSLSLFKKDDILLKKKKKVFAFIKRLRAST
jgi:hypothetical protein